ncbi:hypothetical protein Esti_005904 [Eimeria stiedai]
MKMRALLQRQQKEQQASRAAQSSLLERKKHQEHQHTAKVTRWRWTKAYAQLEQQERTLSYEIKQLLSSELYSGRKAAVTGSSFLSIQPEHESPHSFPDYAFSENAFAERVGGPFLQDRASHPTPGTFISPRGDTWSPQTPPSVPGGEEAQRPVKDKPLGSPKCYPTVTLRHFEGSLDGPTTLLRLVKKVLQATSDKPDTCADCEAPKHQASISEITAETISSFVLPELVRSHQICQVAGPMFQWVRGLLREQGSALEQACAAAGAEVSAALVALQGGCYFLQQCSPALCVRRHRKLNEQGKSQSLTDTEDAVLRGDAPQVRAAAAAASQLKFALKLHSSKTAQLQKQPSAQPSSLCKYRSLNERKPSTISNKAVGTPRSLKAPHGCGIAIQFMWEAALEEYSKRLVQLEESHTQQLGKYQEEICAQKSTLREAVAQMLSQFVSCRRSPSAASADARLGYTLQQHTSSVNQPPGDTNVPTRAKKRVDITSEDATMRSETQSESSSLTPLSTAANSHCGNERVSVPVSHFESDAQGTRGTTTREECQDPTDVALVTVRWLAASHSVDQGGPAETESLPQRLQLAFPFADLQGIKRVVDAQQRLSSIRQKKLTCKRVWERGREAALVDVLRKLEEISTSQRELAEGHRMLAALKDRQCLLRKRLQLHKVKAQEQKRILTAAWREEEETQQKEKLQKAEKERGRREKEKVLLLLFRQKKLAEDQQVQEQIKREEEAAKEPAHLKLLKAARVARRQEQHNLRVFEHQLERQEMQLQAQVLRQRLMVAASKLKPPAVRDPLRLLQQTAASQSQADAGAEQQHLQQKQLHYRLRSFEVQHSYSCAQLMQDIRFRLSAALAEKELSGSKAAQELLLSMSRHTDIKHEGVFSAAQELDTGYAQLLFALHVQKKKKIVEPLSQRCRCTVKAKQKNMVLS